MPIKQKYTKISKSSMSIFRQKLATKLSPKPAPQKQVITSYDQTWLKITVVGGQTQLCPIKLNCQWQSNTVHYKQPQLSCKWFNKTQHSMTMLEGINGSYYQPSLEDVGSVLHVQCLPVLDGVQYEGMPVIKEIGPVKIDPQTEEQANDLLSANKATFLIKIKSNQLSSHTGESLIKIQQTSMRIFYKNHDKQHNILHMDINEEYPKFNFVKNKGKELEILVDKGKVYIEMSNNKVRDVLVLLVKLIRAGLEQDKADVEQNVEGEGDSHIQPKVETKQQEQKIGDLRVEDKAEKTVETSSSVEIKLVESTSNMERSQKMQKQKQVRTPTVQKQPKQCSIDEKSNPKSQKSEQYLKQCHTQLDHKLPMTSIKSSEDFSLASPTTIKKTISKIQTTTTPTSKPTFETLQIADLKKQLRTHEAEILQLKKSLGDRAQTIENLREEITRMKERQANLSCNYFQLEEQAKKFREGQEKLGEEVSYYKNQNRIVKAEKDDIRGKSDKLEEKVKQLEAKLAPFHCKKEEEDGKTVESYQELKEIIQNLSKLRDELEAKYIYMKQEAEKSEEKFNELKESVDQIESEKAFYKKKYENLTQQMQILSSSPTKQRSITQKSLSQQTQCCQFEKKEPPQIQISQKYQKQILDLKQQLKSLVEQNNFLREINAISSKADKKSSSSSKTQLKIQLAEMKKIVNRLTEDLTEKDLCLEQLKKVNKEIGEKLVQANRSLQGRGS